MAALVWAIHDARRNDLCRQNIVFFIKWLR